MRVTWGLFLLFALTFLFETTALAECKVIHYADRDEVSCEGEPLPPPAPEPPKIKKTNDNFTPERKAAIRSLTMLMSRSGTGVSYNKLHDLLAEAKTDLSIYENSAAKKSAEDANLSTLIGTALLRYELTLLDWETAIKLRQDPRDVSRGLTESLGLAQQAIDYFNDNWQ